MIKQREANSWKSVSYAKSITGAQTYTKFPIVLRTTEQSIPTWNVKGNMVQSGTPTPTSPITPSECGERTENLWGETSTTNRYIDNQGNTGTNPNGDVYSLKTFTVSPSTTYTFSWNGFTVGNDNNLPYIRICFYTSNGGTFISRTLVNPNNYLDKYVSFTIPNNCTYVDIRIDSEASTRGQHFDNLMLNIGSTAKPYEPYGQYKLPIISGNTTTNIYLSEPLRKIGGSSDTLASTGIISYNVAVYTFTGNETITDNFGVTMVQGLFNSKPFKVGYMALSDRYTYNPIQSGLAAGLADGEFALQGVAGAYNIAIKDLRYPDAANFKTFLQNQYAAGTPVRLYYQLLTPTTESTTTSAIPTTSGLNTIDVATKLKPSEMSLTYDGYKLCKRQRYSRTENLFDATIEQGTITGQGAESAASNRVRTAGYTALDAGTYTLSFLTTGTGVVFVFLYDSSNNFVKRIPTDWANQPYTFTLDSNYKIRFAIKHPEETSIAPSDVTNIMLNTGSTAKPYQPYLDWE